MPCWRQPPFQTLTFPGLECGSGSGLPAHVWRCPGWTVDMAVSPHFSLGGGGRARTRSPGVGAAHSATTAQERGLWAWVPFLLSISSREGWGGGARIWNDVFFLQSLSGSLPIARVILSWMEMPNC